MKNRYYLAIRLTIIFAFAFTPLVNAYPVFHYKALIETADSLQNCENYSDAIEMFKLAELECLQNDRFYSRDMHYILGSIATCAQHTEDYELLLTALSKIDKISTKIGYDEVFTESFLCFEIAKGHLWRDASESDLSKAIEHINRGQQRDTDPSNKAYWECLLHKYNYLSASKISNHDESALRLEKEYAYFKSICKLPQEEIYNEIYESGLLWSTNLMDRTLNKECLSVLDELSETMMLIIPDFYSLELEAARICAMANLSENEKCIELGNKILTTTHEDETSFSLLCTIKYNVGRCYNGLGTYSKALNTLQSIYTSPHASLLKDIDTNYIKLEIANAFLGLDKYYESEELCKEILNNSPDSSTQAGVYWILGSIANNSNNIQELSFIDDCVSALNQIGYEDLSYAETLAVFANRYANYYQNESALELVNKAIDMFERRGSTNEMTYYNAICLKSTLCSIFEDIEGYVECAQKLQTNVETIIKIFLKDKDYESFTYLLESIINSMYYGFNMVKYSYQKATNDGELTDNQKKEASQAIESNKTQILQLIDCCIDDEDITSWLIENNPNRLGTYYHRRALIYRDMKQYDDGIEYINAILPKLPSNCEMYDILTELRDYQYLHLEGPSSHTSFIQSKFETEKHHLKDLLSSFSLNRRNEMWRQFYDDINKYVEYAQIAEESTKLNEIAFNAILLSKGLLLQSEVDFATRISRTNDNTIIDKYKKWISLSNTNQEQARILEREIIRSLNSNYESELFNITWEDVKNSLNQNEYAVEFRAIDNFGSKHYLAFILGTTYSSPKMIKICDSNELQLIIDKNKFDYSALSKIVWSKLNGLIPPSATIYFSPDMQLHSFPIENLPDFENPAKIISDRWNLYRVSSTRQIIQKYQYSSERDFNLFGGFNYNLDTDYLISDYNRNISNYRSINDSNNTKMRGAVTTVQQLPGSKREVTQLKEIISSKKLKFNDYTENIGTEACFKAYAGTNGNVLHISTHGFYIESPDDSQLSTMLGISSDYYSYENALLRSGLMMAGVNETILGLIDPYQCEDGILTAKEISELDLKNIDIAILSACETGVGAISAEGVFGLQRGFKLAGVKSIMMSLWKVDDNATEHLMIEFYRNWLENNNAQKSLLAAQRSVRNTPGWEDPKYWAGFILLDSHK